MLAIYYGGTWWIYRTPSATRARAVESQAIYHRASKTPMVMAADDDAVYIAWPDRLTRVTLRDGEAADIAAIPEPERTKDVSLVLHEGKIYYSATYFGEDGIAYVWSVQK